MNNGKKLFTTKQLETFIEKAFGSFHYTGNNINVVCPICLSLKDAFYSKRKLAILHDKSTNSLLVKCWVCGYKARDLRKLLKKHKPTLYSEYVNKFYEPSSTTSNTCKVIPSNNNKEQPFTISGIEQPTYDALEEFNNSEAYDDLVEEPVRLPEGFRMLSVDTNRSSYRTRHLEYLRARKLDIETDLWYWGIGYVPWENKELRNRIVIPSFDSIGVINYWTARSCLEANFGQKYKNPENDREQIIFNEFRINWTKPLLIVEGPFDLIKTRLANENATCLLGSELTSNYLLFEKIIQNKTEVILCLDPDARRKQNKIAERLFEFGNRVKVIDMDKTLEDVGSLTSDQFTQIYETAIDYDYDYTLRMKINSLQE